jgi:hypothetical protein
MIYDETVKSATGYGKSLRSASQPWKSAKNRCEMQYNLVE